jgi:YjjG family noncanonical pyrimidine nucleotidase
LAVASDTRGRDVVPRYDCILLDADDTIFDFQRAQATALENTLSLLGHVAPLHTYLEPFRLINTFLWHQYETGSLTPADIRLERFVRLFDLLNIDEDAVAASTRFVEELARGAFLVDGARAVLAKLCPAVPTVLLTNGMAAVQRARVERSGITDRFAAIVVSEEVGIQKPDPRIFHLAVESAGLPATTRALMVGDSLTSDVAGAIAAGYDSCWIDHGRSPKNGPTTRATDPEHAGPQPTYIISQIGELPPLLGL